VPIPFQDPADVETLGAAGFLKLLPSVSTTGYCGALFLINARGEPLEFAYNRVEIPNTFLWRKADLRRHAERRLITSLFSVCGRTPRLLLCLAQEVDGELFSQEVRVSLPVGRISPALQTTAQADIEEAGTAEAPEPLHLFWFPQAPAEGSEERRLLEHLRSHGLLLEPFERAIIGLREVFGSELGDAPGRGGP
jgi:hypothetical protein